MSTDVTTLPLCACRSRDVSVKRWCTRYAKLQMERVGSRIGLLATNVLDQIQLAQSSAE
ncbi:MULTISPECIES: hypothetical protein [unclassified Acidovorax]|uniref:hypothetical protein n=1 Tax=unclassified Acidovorax TaxID=2684926 RepID=UPI00288322B7|nr:MULTISPECIES: hypothetical protein [unclassified Acidovorax]